MTKTIHKRTLASEDHHRLGIAHWPTWSSAVARFPWTYTMDETCYLIEGRVTVTPENGEPVELQAGDLVTFPAGMSCIWDVHEAVRKHYRFG